MAAPVVVFRGLAAVEGTVGTFDAIISGIQQSFDLTQDIEEEVIKDVHGYDVAWLQRNENAKFSCKLKLVSTTATNTNVAAKAPVSAVGGGLVSAMGQPFFAPGSVVVFSAFLMTSLNATFRIMSGSKLSQINDKVAEWDLNLQRYANADQQTAIAAIPT